VVVRLETGLVWRGSEGGDDVLATGVQEGEGNWSGSFGVEM
jgi:hypothetical protein